MMLQPLFEFHRLRGCGKRPTSSGYQLYGDRMVVANATGCSSIYVAICPHAL